MDFLERLFVGASLIAACVCGAVVGLVVHTEIRTFWQRVSFFFGGICTAFFLTAIVTKYLSVTDTQGTAAIGFLLGIFGMSLLQRVKSTVESMDIGEILKARWDDLIAVFRSRGSR